MSVVMVGVLAVAVAAALAVGRVGLAAVASARADAAADAAALAAADMLALGRGPVVAVNAARDTARDNGAHLVECMCRGRFVTVQPVLLSRRSVTRCVVDEAGNINHLLPPSHHARGPDDSLVFVEFGIDFIDEVKAAGLRPSLYFYNLPADDYSWVAVCDKVRLMSVSC